MKTINVSKEKFGSFYLCTQDAVLLITAAVVVAAVVVAAVVAVAFAVLIAAVVAAVVTVVGGDSGCRC